MDRLAHRRRIDPGQRDGLGPFLCIEPQALDPEIKPTLEEIEFVVWSLTVFG